jgi:hypothetical protein
MEIHVKSIEYLNIDKRLKRKIKITLNNGVEIFATSCHESWQQWGGTESEVAITMPIIETHNRWLHGGKLPF